VRAFACRPNRFWKEVFDVKAPRQPVRRLIGALLATTIFASQTTIVMAQTAPRAPAQPAPVSAPAAAQATAAPAVQRNIRSIAVVGNQRLEPDTVRAYAGLRVGQPYSRATLDGALRAIAETELFADFQITDNDGDQPRDSRRQPAPERR
jgi:outer membrane protein insertion porin family